MLEAFAKNNVFGVLLTTLTWLPPGMKAGEAKAPSGVEARTVPRNAATRTRLYFTCIYHYGTTIVSITRLEDVSISETMLEREFVM